MSQLIKKESKDTLRDAPGPDSLFIRGIRYANSAAKFWASLIDEVCEDFPDCDGIELAASSSKTLNRNLLFPELSFARDFERLIGSDFQAIMREALAEMEIFGPPCAVQIRLFSSEKEIFLGELPLDCVDAEIFPFLVVWTLEWAGIPESIWNNEFLEGDFTAEDRKRRLTYRISFSLNNTHLSEGLYRRSISLLHSIDT